jgi:hypothetical protein
MAARSYRTTQAGPASTNRFIVPQEPLVDVVTNLRTNAQASGAAAITTRKPFKYPEGGGDSGVNIDTSYNPTRASVPGQFAALERTNPNAVDAFGAIPATIERADTVAKAIAVGGTLLDFFTGGATAPLTTAASTLAVASAAVTREALGNTLYGTPANTVDKKIGRAIDSTIQGVKTFASAPGRITANALEDQFDELNRDLTALGRGAAAIPGKVAVGAKTLAVNLGLAQSRNATGPASRATKDPINERATRAERSSVSKANQEAVDLRAAKEAAQAARAAAAQRSNDINSSSSQQSQRSEGSYGGLTQQESQDRGGRAAGYGRSY